MGNLYQPERKPGNPHLNPPTYEGVSPTAMRLSNSVLVFLRYDLGHRLMHPMNFAGPMAFHLGVGFIAFNAMNVPDAVHDCGAAMMVYALLMGFLAGHHERRGKALALGNPALHSMDRGKSLLMPVCRRLYIREQTLQGVLEPVLVLLLGIYAISNLGWYFLGWWMTAAGICLMYVESVVTAHTANAVYDLRDSHAEANFMMAVEHATGEDKQDTSLHGGNLAKLSPELLQLKPGQMTIRRERDS